MLGIRTYFNAWATVLRRITDGKILSTKEMLLNAGLTTLRLHVARERGSGEVYAVLALVSAGNYQYVMIDGTEFDEFANLVRSTQTEVRKERAEYLSS